jgi:hypothetical protein
MPQKLRKGCDGTRDRARKGSARRKRPKEKIFSLQDGGGIGGNIGANPLPYSQRPRNDTNKTFSPSAVQPPFSCHNLSSSDFASVLWKMGKARKRDRATSSLCVNNSCHVAVFPTNVCTVSQSSIELKLLPLNSVTTPSPVAFEEALARAPSRAGATGTSTSMSEQPGAAERASASDHSRA